MSHAKTLGSLMARKVVTSDPTSTTNITGAWTMWRGSSLRTAPGRAVSSCDGSKAPARMRAGVVATAIS